MDTLGATLIPLPFVIVIAGAALFGVVLHATPFGRSLYAIGANASAARFSGIDVRKIKLRLFVLSGLVSAIAGIIFTLRFTSARGDNGEGFELAVIAAVLFGGVSIFGGRGSLYGVLLSLLIVGVLRNALTLVDVSSETLTIVTGLLLLSSVLIPNLAAGWRARKDKLSIVAAKR
jgi:rhamnose transport system permease protein